MHIKNNDVLNWICTQAEIILLEFANILDDTTFVITSLTQYEVTFKSSQKEETLTFVFANKYTYGLGIQPLQNIILETSKGRKLLSEVVNSKGGKGAFRRYLANRKPNVSRIAVFLDLYSRYLI